ncbi:FAD-dependent monooxygenase [Saccharopolyspora sp. NPDC002376]
MPEDVVIAGGGPNGLMLACELGLAGIRALVLEREPELVPRNRANGLIGQVVRLLNRRGLYQRLSGTPEPPQPSRRSCSAVSRCHSTNSTTTRSTD